MAASGRPIDKEYQQYYNQYYQQYKKEYQQPGQGAGQQRAPQQHPPTKQQPRSRRPPRRRRGGIGKWITLSILLILLLVVIANKDTIMDLMGPGTQYREYPEELEYTVSRVVTLSGSNYRLSHMLVPVPDDIVTLGGTYIQKIHNSSHKEPQGVTFSVTDETAMWGAANTTRTTPWWDWTMPSDVSGVKVIEKTHHVTSRTVRWSLDETTTGTLDDISSSNDPAVVNMRNKYLVEEWKIKPNEPTIQSLADQIKDRAGTNVYNIVRETYQFLDDQFTYETGVQLEPKDAQVTLSSKKGDCDDQSILIASILRACGIPAWLEIGGLYDRNVGQWGGHAWLKVWIPMLDENGVFDPDISGTVDIDVVNDEFLFRSCYRYAEWESDGNGDHLQDYYMFISYFGSPTITVDWDSSILSSSGNERYLTSDGEVAAPGFEAVAAIATLAAVGIALRRKRGEA